MVNLLVVNSEPMILQTVQKNVDPDYMKFAQKSFEDECIRNFTGSVSFVLASYNKSDATHVKYSFNCCGKNNWIRFNTFDFNGLLQARKLDELRFQEASPSGTSHTITFFKVTGKESQIISSEQPFP